MSIMDRIQRVHARSHLRLAGEAVTYRRASDGTSATMQMVRGKTDHEESDSRGTSVTVRSDDWLVRPSVFQEAFGPAAVPAKGDAVIADGRVYEVRPVGGEPCWRISDQSKQLWRIHSKDVGEDE